MCFLIKSSSLWLIKPSDERYSVMSRLCNCADDSSAGTSGVSVRGRSCRCSFAEECSLWKRSRVVGCIERDPVHVSDCRFLVDVRILSRQGVNSK
jgi:hypothetical protein